MNALVNLSFEEHLVRVVTFGDAPWWVATDVARVLGFKRAPDMVRSLDEDEKGVHILHTLGGNQELSIISESGLYAAIFRSRRPEARRFRKWVTSQVLPELRRTGQYQIGEEPPPEPGGQYDPVRLNALVATVREGRRLWGPEAARHMWLDLGLPIRIGEIDRRYKDDVLAEPLALWLADNPAPTLAEITGGIGLDPESKVSRERVRSGLAELGWWNKRARRGRDELVWAWFPPETLNGER